MFRFFGVIVFFQNFLYDGRSTNIMSLYLSNWPSQRKEDRTKTTRFYGKGPGFRGDISLFQGKVARFSKRKKTYGFRTIFFSLWWSGEPGHFSLKKRNISPKTWSVSMHANTRYPFLACSLATSMLFVCTAEIRESLWPKILILPAVSDRRVMLK